MMVKKPTLLIGLNPKIKPNFLGVKTVCFSEYKNAVGPFLVYLLGMLSGFSVLVLDNVV